MLLEDLFAVRYHLPTKMANLGRAYEIYIGEHTGWCMCCEKVVQYLSVISCSFIDDRRKWHSQKS